VSDAPRNSGRSNGLSKADPAAMLATARARTQKFATKGIGSIGIGFRILDCLASGRMAMSLGAIANATSMAPSKVRFYLVSFLELGLVNQDTATGHYSLGPHAIRLGLAALEQFDVVTASKSALHHLVDQLGYSAFLAVWGNHGPTIVYRADGTHRTVLEVRVGSVLPMLNSAIGRVFLTYLPNTETDNLVRAELADERQSRSFRSTIQKIVKPTKANGVAVARGTLLAGFTAIAAPILDHANLPLAAMSVIGRIGSLDDDPRGAPASLLRSVTTKLAKQVGWKDQ
jgi:DNA-binding IclR family transcriptional regulator